MSKGISLDGGGVKGIGQAAVLSEVKDLGKFEFLAGTSIGAMLVACVGSGRNLTTLDEVFMRAMPRIFEGYWWRRFNLFTPRYPDGALNSILRDLLPGRFGDLDRPTFITAAALDRRALKVFNSTDPEDASLPLWEVVRSAVAAESYFLPWKGYGDGGIIANNPAMVAVAAAVQTLGVKAGDIELLSIGTGEASDNDPVGDTQGWSRIRWGAYVLTGMLDGFSDSMHAYFARSMNLKKYKRIQFFEGKGWAMDDPATVYKALKAWGTAIDNGIRVVNEF